MIKEGCHFDCDCGYCHSECRNNRCYCKQKAPRCDIGREPLTTEPPILPPLVTTTQPKEVTTVVPEVTTTEYTNPETCPAPGEPLEGQGQDGDVCL